MVERNEWTDLRENVETTIFEGILKLGYSDNESFSIYYDLDLLNHLLHTDFDTVNSMNDYLYNFSEYMMDYISGFSFTLLVNKRFKFTVLKDGILKIKDNNKENTFLRDIINLVNTQKFNIDDVIEIFKNSGEDFVLENSEHPEFKYVLYFKDQTIDKFKYCFNFDELGSYYHRLLDFSYEQSLEEDHLH
ncbi:MAG: hypothetical protein K0S61_324 [Anaerocolumna sp.]|nr:hypothetical protein [Anaerocolumna sp.]